MVIVTYSDVQTAASAVAVSIVTAPDQPEISIPAAYAGYYEIKMSLTAARQTVTVCSGSD